MGYYTSTVQNYVGDESDTMDNNGIARHKIDSLQAVRALAFFGIFAIHCDIGQYGAWGVSVFIILSGFLMYNAYKDRNIDSSLFGSLRFSIKKISKLYPLHILMTIAAFVLTLSSIANRFSWLMIAKRGFSFVINLFLAQAWFPDERIYFSMNIVSWYLSLCLFLYFAFPFVLRYIKRIKSIKQALLVSLIIYLAQIIVGLCLNYIDLDINFLRGSLKWVTYIFPVFRLGDFVIGCCWGYIFSNRKRILNSVKSTIAEVVVLLAIIGSEYIFANNVGILGAECFKYNMLFTPSSVALVYLFAINQGFISKVLTCKPIVYIGNISPYAFLIHHIVIRSIDLFSNIVFGAEMNKYLSMVVSFLLTVILSEIYIRIEKRIIGMRKRKVSTAEK